MHAAGYSSLTGVIPLSNRALVVVSAAPGVGRCAFCMNMVVRLLQGPEDVEVVWLRTREAGLSVEKRFACIVGGVDIHRTFNDELDCDECARLNEALSMVRGWPLRVIRPVGWTLTDALTTIQNTVRRPEKTLLVVEYLPGLLVGETVADGLQTLRAFGQAVGFTTLAVTGPDLTELPSGVVDSVVRVRRDLSKQPPADDGTQPAADWMHVEATTPEGAVCYATLRFDPRTTRIDEDAPSGSGRVSLQ